MAAGDMSQAEFLREPGTNRIVGFKYYGETVRLSAADERLSDEEVSDLEALLVDGGRTPTRFGDLYAADATAAWQAYFDYCRDTGTPWIVPRGSFAVNAAIIYNGGTCYGEFVTPNDSALTQPDITIAPLSGDVTAISAATINGWTGLVRGTDKSSDWASYYGCTVAMISGDEVHINRLGFTPPEGGVFYREVFVVHDTDGSIYPPIAATKAVTWTAGNTAAFATVNREPIVITGLRVRVNGVGTGERTCAVKVRRPNTILVGGNVSSDSANAVQQGFLTQYCSGVRYISCVVEGLLDTTTQYAFNNDTCCDVSYTDCSETNCRRGIDGTGVKRLRVSGGSFPDGVGAHWGIDCRVEDGAYLSSDPSNTAPAWWAGENFVVTGCKIVVRNNQFQAMGLRTDNFEARGTWHCYDNEITFDCTANLGTARYISDFSSNSTTHDWGRLIYMPSSIRTDGNRVKQLGAGFTSEIYPVRMFGNAPTPPQGISAGGVIQASLGGGSYDMDATVLNGANPRIMIQLNKHPCWTQGSGYKIVADDLPALRVYLFCSSTHPTPNSGPRNSFRGVNIGTFLWQANYGAFTNLVVGCSTLVSALGSGRPSAGAYATPVGDEGEYRQRLLSKTVAWTPGTITDGSFAAVDISVPGLQTSDRGDALFNLATADGWHYSTRCNVAGTARVCLFNDTGGPVTLGSGFLTYWAD